MAYQAMSDKMMSSTKKEQEEIKKQLRQGAADKSAQVSAQAAQGDSQQVAMQKAVASKRIQKQQTSSQSNMPANQGGGGGGNSMNVSSSKIDTGSGGGGGGEKEKRDSIFQKTMDAGKQSGGDPMAMASAAIVAGLEEGQAIRQERVELEKEAKKEEAKGLQNVGDIWTALAGQMKGLLR